MSNRFKSILRSTFWITLKLEEWFKFAYRIWPCCLLKYTIGKERQQEWKTHSFNKLIISYKSSLGKICKTLPNLRYLNFTRISCCICYFSSLFFFFFFFNSVVQTFKKCINIAKEAVPINPSKVTYPYLSHTLFI